MPLAVASRFAVLRVDDDPVERPRANPKTQNKAVDGKKTDGPGKKKNKQDGKVNQTQNAKSKSSTTQQKKKKVPAPTVEQWDQWKKKDAEVVAGNYESDLHQAILLSKVDFEKNKDLYDQRKKASEEEKKLPVKKSKKSNKPQPMSLDQFNNLHKENQETDVEHSTTNGDANGFAVEGDEEFFEKINDDAKEALRREETLALRKSREPDIYKAITQAQYEDSLEKKDGEITTLNAEIVRLKTELHSVKVRNKRLCQILANGEMKDKAELLFELDRMHSVKDELSSEVSSLHVQLEQERSKNHVLTTDPKNKSQSKKRATSESTQQ